MGGGLFTLSINLLPSSEYQAAVKLLFHRLLFRISRAVFSQGKYVDIGFI